MNDQLLYNIAKLIVLGLVVHLFIIVYVVWSGYEGRDDLVVSQRAGCERSKLDRNTNAEGWRIASEARRRDAQYVVAQKYADIALDLENRGAIECSNVFPSANLIP